jgi:hypothetical protein
VRPGFGGLALLFALTACMSEVQSPPITAAKELVPLTGFGQATLVVDGEHEWPVMVADEPWLRSLGLMNVTDLGLWAGMVFEWDEPTLGGFWMKNTLIPLTVYWIDQQGAIVAIADMIPCPPEEQDCPSWHPGAPYVTALEVPAGTGEQLGISSESVLTFRG